MARQGLAALTGGAQEGYEFVDDRKKEKAIRELLGRENVRMKNQAGKRRKDADRMRSGQYDWWEQYEKPQNWLQKFGGLFGRGQPEPEPMKALQTPVDPGYAARTQEYGGMDEQVGPPEAPRYKHGGSVRQMRKKYANGGRALGPHQGGPGRVKFQPYEHGGKAIDIFGGESPNLTDEERFERTQKIVVDRGTSRADALFDKMHEIGRSNRSIYGAGPEQEAAVRGIETDTPPEGVTEGIDTQPTGAGGGAPVSAGGGQALPAAPSALPSAGEEKEVDFSTEAREIMPEDMPSQTSKDWEDEQNYWAASAIMEGKDPWEAIENVKKRQLSGFTSYSMQATALIDAGDLEGAARALYAAYQHFPNGKDVRFGMQTGKDGQRVMVAMGRDEKTGESSGPPQVIDRNTITRMVENMQKPGALRAWTTDWQNTEQKLWEQGFSRDELKEKGRHNRAMEGAYEARTAAVGAGGGMKQADYDRAFKAFREDRALMNLDDEGTAKDLADIMARLYQQTGGGREGASDNAILKAVMAAHADGSLDELREQYGLQ